MGWDYHSAAASAAGVIPTLLLALVLEKQLLVSAVHVSDGMRRTIDALPGWVKWLLARIAIVRPGLSVETMPALFAPTALVLSAVLAEMVALLGVAVPTAWTESGWGNFAAITGLIFVGWAILMILVQVAIGLIGIARRAETQGGGEGPSTAK